MNPITAVRAFVLALLGVLGVFFPGLLPEGAEEKIAEFAVEAVGLVLLIWGSVAAWRVKKQAEGSE